MFNMQGHHSHEYKEYIAKLIVEENKVAKHLCRELDLAPSTVSSWVKRYRIKQGYYPNSNDLTTSSELKKQQAALEKQIRELEEENEILKKAMHIFTKNPL